MDSILKNHAVFFASLSNTDAYTPHTALLNALSPEATKQKSNSVVPLWVIYSTRLSLGHSNPIVFKCVRCFLSGAAETYQKPQKQEHHRKNNDATVLIPFSPSTGSRLSLPYHSNGLWQIRVYAVFSILIFVCVIKIKMTLFTRSYIYMCATNITVARTRY